MANDVVIRPATIEDVNTIKLRQIDIDEITLTTGLEYRQALVKSFEISKECWACEKNGNVFCLSGYVPNDVCSAIWIVFADGLSSLPLSFFKLSKNYVKHMLTVCEQLENYASVNNEFVIKWAKWMGFTVDEAQHIENYGLFHRVHIRRR